MINENRNFVYFFCFKYIYQSVKLFKNINIVGVKFLENVIYTYRRCGNEIILSIRDIITPNKQNLHLLFLSFRKFIIFRVSCENLVYISQ